MSELQCRGPGRRQVLHQFWHPTAGRMLGLPTIDSSLHHFPRGVTARTCRQLTLRMPALFASPTSRLSNEVRELTVALNRKGASAT